MASIAAGRSASYLRAYARAVRAYGHQVILSFAPEADGPWYGWGYRQTRPGRWVAAWRHVVTVFRKAGRRTSTWMWDMNINGASGAPGPVRDWWPGRDYSVVGPWTAITFRPRATSRRCSAPLCALPSRITAKPVMIGEVGIGSASGRPGALPGLFGIRRNHLLGLVYFDAGQQGHALSRGLAARAPSGRAARVRAQRAVAEAVIVLDDELASDAAVLAGLSPRTVPSLPVERPDRG